MPTVAGTVASHVLALCVVGKNRYHLEATDNQANSVLQSLCQSMFQAILGGVEEMADKSGHFFYSTQNGLEQTSA